jgi:2-keto-3-deoxy-L-rhamnonate aldolase RhmA
MSRADAGRTFRDRVRQRETIFGAFVKTPTVHAIEILGASGYDFVVIDAEHALFDRCSIDACVLAARAVAIAAIVRVRSRDPASIGDALDAGAAGVMIPHLTSAEVTLEAVRACRYWGSRGYSNSPRAGGYGERGMWEHIDKSDAETFVLGMIEDPEAIDAIDGILGVPGLDAIFIGRGDLGAAYRDRTSGAPQVKTTTGRVIVAAARLGTPTFLLVSDGREAAAFAHQGVCGFILGSDQGFLRQAASSSLLGVRSAIANCASDKGSRGK